MTSAGDAQGTAETDPFSPGMKRCPYPGYDRWRAAEGLTWSPEIAAWLVTRYEDVRAVLADHRRFSSQNSLFGGPQVDHPDFPSMANRDEPEHRRLRALVSHAFSPRHIEQAWNARTRECVEGLLDAVEARGSGRMEVVGDLAYPLPVQIIAEIIGVPSQLHPVFKQWSNVIVRGIGRAPQQEAPAEPVAAPSDELIAQHMAAYRAAVDRGEAQPSLFLYAFEQIADRRAQPREDLISRLVLAEAEGKRLTDSELIAFLVLLLVAGNETTTNLINHAVRALAADPALQARVRADRTLLDPMIDEALRWESPIQGLYRRATEDAEVGGTLVREGEALLVLYGAANHDPAVYDEPETFSLDRYTGGGARGHLAFGHGIHYCLGANLARLEASAALNGMLDRFSRLSAVTEAETIEWSDTPFFRGPRAFEIAVER